MYNEEELLNKSYDKCTVLKYISEAKSFIHSGIKFDEIHKNDNFKSFRSMNKICIHDAQIVDILLNKTAGTRWLSAYHYLPDENKLNVGLLTFNLE